MKDCAAISFACLAACWQNMSFGRDLPTTEEFQNLLQSCAVGANINVSADLIGSITTIYKGDKTQGKVLVNSRTEFLSLIPENDRLKAYELYVSCIDKLLNPAPKERCNSDNLLAESNVPLAVSVPGESLSRISPEPNGWSIDFTNKENGTGMALVFAKSLDVRGCHQLELRGISTNPFQFVVELKAKLDNADPVIVARSTRRFFRAATNSHSVKMPLSYDGTVSEIVLNFVGIGEESKFVVESLRLLP